MSVQKTMVALKARIRAFMMARANVLVAMPVGTTTTTLQVDDVSKFNVCHIMRNYPQVIVFDLTTGTKAIGFLRLKSVDTTANTMTFSENPDFNIPIGAIIKFASNWTELKAVRLGDPTVLDEYPVICIEPTSKANSFVTLPGGMNEAMSFDIFTHVLDDNSENAVYTCIRLTEDLEDLLNGDMHLKVDTMDKTEQYNRPYKSMVTNSNYGRSNKGAFLRSSQMTWTADMYWFKFIAAQNPELSPFE